MNLYTETEEVSFAVILYGQTSGISKNGPMVMVSLTGLLYVEHISLTKILGLMQYSSITKFGTDGHSILSYDILVKTGNRILAITHVSFI